MIIQAEAISKMYFTQWVIKNISFELTSDSYAITGPNGSGKSTLAKLIAGYLTPTEGKLTYIINEKKLSVDLLYQYINYCAPYIELIEEFTIRELWDFHTHFKKNNSLLSFEEFLEKTQLKNQGEKEIKYFSSGMKQRLKLGLSLYTSCELLILDEPTSNLDKQGIIWYQNEIQKINSDTNKTILICSNDEKEYTFCSHQINLQKN